ncbi:MAG TPA: iron-sulfur cluster assembly accessory protein [Methanosarcinaceae archaeon]|nr:iron-sulfur cluster assembly accessory protein [Methanosarcinaceae archaeon]
MVTITETAAVELKSLLESEEKHDHSLRIFIAGMGCSGIQYGLALDNESKDDDVTVSSNDVNIVMSKDISEALNDAKVDYIDTTDGKGFVIDNPNAVSACSSGCSSCQ